MECALYIINGKTKREKEEYVNQSKRKTLKEAIHGYYLGATYAGKGEKKKNP